ncbi:MAG: lipopolysaccharide biosynthesis protein [Bradymonadia bacterium]
MAERDEATTAGRGFLVITGAKLWFMVGGALITFGLPKLLDAAGYGQYTDLNNTLSILSMMVITGGLQAIAKFVAETPEAAGGVARQGLKLMALVGVLVGGGVALAAPWLAEWRSTPELTMGYVAAGGVLFCYSLYTVFIGVLNGRKAFTRQALFDVTFTTLKATLILGFAAAGFGVLGAFSGFALAAALILVLAVLRVGPTLGDGPKQPKLVSFALQVMLYTLVFNLIFKLDVLWLKPTALETLGTTDLADALVGRYGLAVQLSRLPWQATLAITFVIFPMVSAATFQNDLDRTRLYIRETLRYGALLVAVASVVLSALPEVWVSLWGPDYAQAAVALAWTAPAYFLFSIFNLINTLLTSAGRAGWVLGIGSVTALVATALYGLLLPMAADEEALLMMAGMATSGAFVVGLALGAGALWRLYGSPFVVGTYARVVLWGGALVVGCRLLVQAPLVSWLSSHSGLLSVAVIGASAVVIAVVFVVGLWGLREFNDADRARFRRVIGR